MFDVIYEEPWASLSNALCTYLLSINLRYLSLKDSPSLLYWSDGTPVLYLSQLAFPIFDLLRKQLANLSFYTVKNLVTSLFGPLCYDENDVLWKWLLLLNGESLKTGYTQG